MHPFLIIFFPSTEQILGHPVEWKIACNYIYNEFVVQKTLSKNSLETFLGIPGTLSWNGFSVNDSSTLYASHGCNGFISSSPLSTAKFKLSFSIFYFLCLRISHCFLFQLYAIHTYHNLCVHSAFAIYQNRTIQQAFVWFLMVVCERGKKNASLKKCTRTPKYWKIARSAAFLFFFVFQEEEKEMFSCRDFSSIDMNNLFTSISNTQHVTIFSALKMGEHTKIGKMYIFHYFASSDLIYCLLAEDCVASFFFPWRMTFLHFLSLLTPPCRLDNDSCRSHEKILIHSNWGIFLVTE